MVKEYAVGETAYIGRNINVKFFNDNNSCDFINKIVKNETEVKILKVEKVSPDLGGYAYYISCEIEGEILESTHSIPQNDFFSKSEWKRRLELDEKLKALGYDI